MQEQPQRGRYNEEVTVSSTPEDPTAENNTFTIGGPIDSVRVSLCLYGDEVDPLGQVHCRVIAAVVITGSKGETRACRACEWQ
jgi:hypothetical protein